MTASAGSGNKKKILNQKNIVKKESIVTGFRDYSTNLAEMVLQKFKL